jgi:ribosomal protein S18 acetylase RimI-like enzyme
MSLRVTELTDPVEAFAQAGSLLVEQPARYNVLLTILEQSRELARAGRYWVVRDGQRVVGFALQSPPGARVGLTRMSDEAIRTLVASIDGAIPGVVSEATGAATFTGHFTERHHVPVTAVEAQRFYELDRVESVATAPGALRLAATGDRPTLVDWTRAFAEETGNPPEDNDAVVDLGLTHDRLWVWDDGGPVAMAGSSKPIAGVARVQRVYTPSERRGTGYATACVEHLSRRLTDRGLRCVLYTQMSNPTSNAIYRRIGYAPIAEVLNYRFGTP